MRSFFQLPIQVFAALPKPHKQIITLLGVSIVFVMLLPSHQPTSDTEQRHPSITMPRVTNSQDAVDTETSGPVLTQTTETTAQQTAAVSDINHTNYTIRDGDTLSDIFADKGISQRTVYQVLEADLNVLALDTLQPGDKLRFTQDADGTLQQLELVFNPAHKVTYTLQDNEGYEVNETRLEGDWQAKLISGDIQYSFTGSAEKAGLTAAETQILTDLLSSRIDFRRDIRAGDHFEVLLSQQSIDGVLTGTNRIEAVHINNNRRTVDAYLFEGNYYDADGRSLERAFLRYPFKGHYRMSSRYDPYRKHPVTGLIRPHNGTDFATPTGTPILATGDGIVTRVLHHKYAGNYIQIQHGQTYTTRYLHLSKSLVHRGQHVTRGQTIALSGATGRVTGPHIHYEFHVNNHPVNPMTAKIPLAKTLNKEEMHRFDKQRESLQAQLQTLDENEKLAAKTPAPASDTLEPDVSNLRGTR